MIEVKRIKVEYNSGIDEIPNGSGSHSTFEGFGCSSGFGYLCFPYTKEIKIDPETKKFYADQSKVDYIFIPYKNIYRVYYSTEYTNNLKENWPYEILRFN